MSFSSDVKAEMLSNIVTDRSPHCNRARLGAIINVCGYVSKADNNKFIVIHNENLKILNLTRSLISDIFGAEVGVKGNDVVINDSGLTDRMTYSLGLSDSSNFSLNPPIMPELVKRTCCKRAYIAMAFITGGSVTDPDKQYHIELVSNDYEYAAALRELIAYFGIEMKIVERKNRYVVYCKEAEQIVDLLNVISAHRALLNFENLRVIKEVRNNINRVVNCETANINRVVGTAVRQLGDIRYIAKKKGLNFLPYNLRQAAELRLEYPDASLKEIGELLSPPIGKSGVNHRFNKINEIAERLKGEH